MKNTAVLFGHLMDSYALLSFLPDSNNSQKSAIRKKKGTDVLLVIKSKTGHQISEFSKFPEQRELLFDKGMRLKFGSVREARNGQVIFELTEI